MRKSDVALGLAGLTPLMERTSGSVDVTIGVIDGPVVTRHPDLVGEQLREIPAGRVSACIETNYAQTAQAFAPECSLTRVEARPSPLGGTRRIVDCIFLGLMAGCALLMSLVVIAQTLLNFEDLPAGTTVNDQYVRRGVRFSAAHLAADPNARSGTRVLRTVSPTTEVFTPIPLRMAFIKPQTRIKLFAMSPGLARNGTLRALNAGGVVVAQDGPKLVAADRFTTAFEVALPGPGFSRAELHLEGAAHFAIDDLEFDNVPKPTMSPVQVIETRQPSAKDNAAVSGRFPTEFRPRPPPEPITNKPEEEEEDDAAERSRIEAIQSAPAVEQELAPGGTAELHTHVVGRAGLAGSARWSGTAAALPLTLSLNGSTLTSGKSYGLGTNRGGADVGGMAQSAGDVTLTVINTSTVRVTVRLTLAIVPSQGK